jgi:hypothetical protein
MYVVTVAGTAVVAAGAVARACMVIFGDVTVEVAADDVLPEPTLPGLVDGAEADPSGMIDIIVKDPTTQQAALDIATWLPTAAVALTGFVLLLRILRAARTQPFTTRAVRQFSVLGLVVFLGGTVAWAGESIAATILAGTVSKDDFSTVISLAQPLVSLLIGMSCFAVGQILANGTAMRDELEEVI